LHCCSSPDVPLFFQPFVVVARFIVFVMVVLVVQMIVAKCFFSVVSSG